MNKIRVLIAVIMLAPTLSLHAQVLRARKAPAGPAPAAEAEKQEPSCPCDRHNFKALSEKGTAVAEYWDARRKAKVSRAVSGTAVLFAYLAQSGPALNAAAESYGRAMEELRDARQKATELRAVKVVGDDLEDETIEFLIKKGVDYELTP